MKDRAPLVLVAEDHDDDLDLTIRGIRCAMKDATVVSAHDGAQAASYLGIGVDDGLVRPLPDMAIIDIKMPRIDGLSLLRQMRDWERTRRLPVLVYSSAQLEGDITECKRLGASYARKPFDISEYCDVVRDFVLQHLR